MYGAINAFKGDATFYAPGLAACGKTNKESDLIVAVSHVEYGKHANPNKAPVCGKCALVKADGTTKSVKVNVVDSCPGCNSGSVELSPAAFKKLASVDKGRIQVTWDYVKC
ncbi:papain inhibitor-like [Paramacrobiotus metropolitanus]|uniref:papain inhibitor-like n=1 Tax=Paramacrobiotus metropolitanus TaxID=2943436 RepID=UPI0024456566|nr:papain inhibitor-like [Paramacrobiotus metropolitanus]